MGGEILLLGQDGFLGGMQKVLGREGLRVLGQEGMKRDKGLGARRDKKG